MKNHLAGWLGGAGLVLSVAAAAQSESFVVSDIRVEGLQRISAGTVFAALPISVSDRVDQGQMSDAARALFRTGNFEDVQIGRDGSVLVVVVVERPSISEIKLEGNKAIKSEDLLKGLKSQGLAEGQVFKRSTLEGIRLELQRQYVSQGRYDAVIDAEVEEQPRNRVAVNITIDEGNTAAIRHINIVGNKVFTDEELSQQFELKTTGWLSWLTSDDKYSREKLNSDMDKLTAYYKDRGYLKFAITSTQVSITPDRESVYISLNVSEGDKYTVKDVQLAGDIIVSEEELRKLILLSGGDTFSQIRVTNTEEAIKRRLGNEGYLFAKAEGVPEVDEDGKTVSLRFFVDPGKRTYVRRIEFRGNTKTVDEVLRREMRQMEAAPADSAKIEQSRVRLERLGFFKDVKVETPEVPGHDDLVDVQYSVEEQPSGSIGASIGYAQGYGMLLGANLQQNNFLGTGKQVGVSASTSKYQTAYSFSYLNPYYTEDGVSRGFSLYFRETDYDELNIASYSTDTFGASMNFGYPLSETSRLGFSLGVSNTQIDAGIGAVQEIIGSPRLIDGVRNEYANLIDYADGTSGIRPRDANGRDLVAPTFPLLPNDPSLTSPSEGFLDRYGDTFTNYTIGANWNQSTLNRGQLATRGYSQALSVEVAIPGSDLEFFKISWNGQYFLPLNDTFTLRFRGMLGYGDGYGNINELPFYENFFAGGFNSVRGFKNNTLGPRSTPAVRYSYDYPDPSNLDRVVYVRDPVTGKLVVRDVFTDDDQDPFGGNVKIEGGIELLFPLPFIKDQRSVRSAFFLDAGNVFNTECDTTLEDCYDVELGELRYSVGFGVTWITGFGPLTFSLAMPMNKQDDDEQEIFQFSIGRGF